MESDDSLGGQHHNCTEIHQLVLEWSYILNVIPLKLVARCEMREAVSQEVTGFPSFTSGVVGRNLSGALMVCARQRWRERPHPRLEARASTEDACAVAEECSALGMQPSPLSLNFGAALGTDLSGSGYFGSRKVLSLLVYGGWRVGGGNGCSG